jgi:hypothetical protein
LQLLLIYYIIGGIMREFLSASSFRICRLSVSLTHLSHSHITPERALLQCGGNRILQFLQHLPPTSKSVIVLPGKLCATQHMSSSKDSERATCNYARHCPSSDSVSAATSLNPSYTTRRINHTTTM